MYAYIEIKIKLYNINLCLNIKENCTSFIILSILKNYVNKRSYVKLIFKIKLKNNRYRPNFLKHYKIITIFSIVTN